MFGVDKYNAEEYGEAVSLKDKAKRFAFFIFKIFSKYYKLLFMSFIFYKD